MLKEVGDGSLTLTPVKVVPIVQETQAEHRVAAPSQQTTRQWAQTHSVEIAQYNAWASQSQPYSQRVRQWREQVETAAGETTSATEPRTAP